MKKSTLIACLALSALALVAGACKAKTTAAPMPAPAGYIDHGK